MMIVRSYQDVKSGAYAREGYDNIVKTEFFSADDTLGWPTAYLVEQSARSEIRPHFHPLDQFQVFVAGGGTVGRERINPVAVHYAGAHTGYGPILSGEDGISYFTLRPPSHMIMNQQSAHYLPERKAEQQQRSKPPSHALGRVDVTNTPVTEGNTFAVISRLDDGAAAVAVALVPGEEWSPSLNSASDTYLLVLAGNGKLADHELASWSCAFVVSGEDPGTLIAGGDGLQFLALSFPTRTEDGPGVRTVGGAV